MSRLPRPSEENHFLAEHVAILCRSYRHWMRRDLVKPGMNDEDAARYLFTARFALLSHDTTKDPVFNYANQIAMDLFGMNWESLTALPSRLSAEPVNRDERERLLEEVRTKGFIENYQGVRISRQGRRFLIDNAIVWNLIDEDGAPLGQAAIFKEWKFLP